jgi:hypothetical protein
MGEAKRRKQLLGDAYGSEAYFRTKVYSSIKDQLELMIKSFRNNSKALPIFQTTVERFAVLRQVASDLASDYTDLNFRVFDDSYCCVVLPYVPLDENCSYTWLQKSDTKSEWSVMALPPGAIRADCLTVCKQESSARQAALDILNSIRTFPLHEWDLKDESEYYQTLLLSLPQDSRNIIEIWPS